MIRLNLRLALAAPVLLLMAASAGAACIVADPTGTPLNVRLAPYAASLGTIENGVPVLIRETTYDSKGQPWVHIVQAGSGSEIGWVYRKYLDCR